MSIWLEKKFRGGKRLRGPRLFTDSELWRIFLPVTAEQGFAYMVGIISSLMVAVVGEDAVSGVSLVEFVMAFFMAVFWALAAGGTVVSGQYLGKRNTPMARLAADQLVRMSFTIGLVVTILVFWGSDFILDVLFGQISPGVRENASTYLCINLFSIPAISLYGAGAAIFRTVGNARMPMMTSFLTGITSLSGSLIAVFLLDMGTAGVATSSLVARWVGCIALMWCVSHKHFALRIHRTIFERPRWDMLKSMLSVGIPFGLESGLFQLGRIAILSIIATYGTAAIAANAVGGNICFLNALPGMAVTLGLTPVIARCAGAGDWDQARYYTRKILFGVHVGHIISGTAIMLCLNPVLGLYGLSAEATDLAWQIVAWHASLAVLTWPVAFVLPVTLRAAGDARFPMYVAVGTMLVCRILLSWVLGTWCGLGLMGTWYAMFLDWVVRWVFFVWRYKSDIWTRYRLV